MNWLFILLSDSNRLSTKRLITLITLLLIVAVTIGALFQIVVDSELIWVLAALCSSSSGLTVIEKKWK